MTTVKNILPEEQYATVKWQHLSCSRTALLFKYRKHNNTLQDESETTIPEMGISEMAVSKEVTSSDENE